MILHLSPIDPMHLFPRSLQKKNIKKGSVLHNNTTTKESIFGCRRKYPTRGLRNTPKFVARTFGHTNMIKQLTRKKKER